MQNRMLEFFLITQLQVKLLEFLTKEPWLYKSPSMSYFMNLTILSKKESFDDDLGLEASMGKLQIEDRRQQEEIREDPKKEESPLALPPPHQVKSESSQDLPKDWKFVINHSKDQIIGNPSNGV